jgi:hypothetical protein
LAVHDDGGGPALYAGGWFTSAGGVAANRTAKWDGSSWSALGSGMNDVVHSLAAHDDGGGPALYAGGWFTSAGGVAANRIAKWDGFGWAPLGSGLSDTASVLCSHDDGGSPRLYAGGSFMMAFDSGDSFLASWGCDTVPPVLVCPPLASAIDRMPDGPGEVVTFTVTATDDVDPSPAVVCVPASGSTFPLGTTMVNCTATDASGNQSTCQFPVTVTLKVRQRGF